MNFGMLIFASIVAMYFFHVNEGKVVEYSRELRGIGRFPPANQLSRLLPSCLDCRYSKIPQLAKNLDFKNFLG